MTDRRVVNRRVRSLMRIAFSVGIMFGSGLGYGFLQNTFNSQQVEFSRFGRAEYEQLKPGMSLTEVRSILYRGIEVSRTATTATFVWENADGSKIIVTFEHDLLKSKKQSGLK